MDHDFMCTIEFEALGKVVSTQKLELVSAIASTITVFPALPTFLILENSVERKVYDMQKQFPIRRALQNKVEEILTCFQNLVVNSLYET